jgi:hypothetical protein
MMKSCVFLLALICLAGCGGSSKNQLAEVLSMSGESPQLIRGFHPAEQGWRWTQSEFAVALRPPRKAPEGTVLSVKYSLPDAVLAQLKETTLDISVEGIPLPPEKISKSGLQEVRRDVPAEVLKGKSGVNVEFKVHPFTPPGEVDRRELGVILHSVGLVKKS